MYNMQSEKIKIIWQAHEAIVSGANIAMLEYVDALASVFDFFIILPHAGNMQRELAKRDIPYMIIHQYGWTNVYPWWNIGKWIRILVRSAAAVWQTKQLLKQERPDLVSTNTLVPFVASIAARIIGVPHVWWIHEFGKEDFGFTTGWGHENASLSWMQSSSKLIIGNSIAISAKFANFMPHANIATIYQPVSWISSKQAVATSQARFLMFGQLVPSKGHLDVLQAMLANKQAGKPMHILHIKGPSEIKSYLTELQQFVEENDLKAFIHIEVGYFKKEEIMPLYEVLIVASKAEAFGRVIVEANKAGLRVLVRNSGGAPELVNDSNGLLFSNQSELAAALCGERTFPNTLMLSNYNESEEIRKLNKLLTTTCS
jgi:glycosyltransferase involved in cell wall biosynthesis